MNDRTKRQHSKRARVAPHTSATMDWAGEESEGQFDPPSWKHLMLEARAPAEFLAGLASFWVDHWFPRGDGHPVLVFPGMAASDRSTFLLRRFLKRLGYQAFGWEQGLNLGPRHGVLSMCRDRVHELNERFERPVTLIGWSLGGVYAREMAKLEPERVRQVITLASPFAGSPHATNAYPLFRLLTGHHVHREPGLLDRIREAPPVPTTSIYSRTDGIVSWVCSVQQPAPLAENIEVRASHLGIGFNPLALFAVADRLAQSEKRWQPFEMQGLRRFLFAPSA